MTSAENSVSEPPNLKMFWGKIPPQPLPSALARDNAPSPPAPSTSYASYGPE